MTQFAYQVRNAKGETATGQLSASSADEAARVLRGDGNVIIDLRAQSAPAEARRPAADQPSRKRARRDDVIFFANQLAVMVDTGVPLPDALDGIAAQTAHEGFRSVLDDLSEQVKTGSEFSAALARYQKVFGKLFVAMVRASEASGTMGKMLQRVSRYLEEQRQIRKRVRGALLYPVGMLTFSVIVVVCMLTFVLPRFERIYAGRDAVLPMPTRVLMGLSGFLVSYWPLLLAGLVSAAVGAHLFVRRPRGRGAFDRLRITVPVLGGIARRASIARSLRTLATMIGTGVSMLESMEITADVAGNVHYSRIWRALGERLKEGATMSEEMAAYPLIPTCVSQMVAAGERTGKLAAVLDRVAGFCEDDLKTTIQTATGMIEPIMIVVMGLIVGGIAMALLLPVFSLSKVIAG